MDTHIKDFMAAVHGPKGCLDGWLESATESDVRDAIKAVMAAPPEPSIPAMTLRDYFAAKAMQGVIAQACGTALGSDPKYAADYAYATADAMLIARESSHVGQ